MESNIEIKKESVESAQRHIENQLSISTDSGDGDWKRGPEGNLGRAVKTEIKDEFVEGDPRYEESQVSTSLNQKNLKSEGHECNLEIVNLGLHFMKDTYNENYL
uniref:Uncharacterized protein LOC114348301 isoform X1 n=1 Tax=Diabrotica virgifera virgifera TaxID=50390 RepID=A0A6P7HAI8_DIAVI